MSLSTRVDFNDDNKQWIIRPVGEIDIYTSSEFKEEVVKAYSDKKADLVIEDKT